MVRLACIGAVTCLALSCTTSGLRAGCHSNQDCPANFACELTSGACHCTSNAACGNGEFCNGVDCQASVGCQTSLDCPASTFCDTTSGHCLDAIRCTTDIQCDIGQVCDSIRYQCVPGCHEAGDCRLGQVCRCKDVPDGGDNTGSQCRIGQCEGDTCDDDSFCIYGDRCLPDAADDGKKHCVKDERGPYCQQCAIEPGTPDHCGAGPNFCLLDRKVTYYNTYCGVDCSHGEECPWGFYCRDILILTHALCSADTDCPANGKTCQTDADCPATARCDPAAHQCAGKCSFNEDSQKGFCECTQNSDCPNDACDTSAGHCFITKRPCTPGGNECTEPIYCVFTTERAACKIGDNCTPVNGVTCQQVLTQQSTMP